jgi:hypothetical protein
MNTNEKIAKWLGLKCKTMRHPDGYNYLYLDDLRWEIIDFLHDRNQQKWIKDKLKELGYTWLSSFNGKHYFFDIMRRWNINDLLTKGKNEDEDLAFISAVEQLIDKEK